MRKALILLAVIAAPGSVAVQAQFPDGNTGHPFASAMEESRRRLEDSGDGITQASMAESIGQEKLEAFLAGALVRLVLFPDGQFTAYSKKGGELVSFSLGRKVVSTGEESTTDEDNWVKRSGTFTVPKRPQNVSLSVMTSGQELNADCFNQFGHSEVPTTFHLGVLDGLFCVGLVDDSG
jgi:hypothetical protein